LKFCATVSTDCSPAAGTSAVNSAGVGRRTSTCWIGAAATWSEPDLLNTASMGTKLPPAEMSTLCRPPRTGTAASFPQVVNVTGRR